MDTRGVNKRQDHSQRLCPRLQASSHRGSQPSKSRLTPCQLLLSQALHQPEIVHLIVVAHVYAHHSAKNLSKINPTCQMAGLIRAVA